MGALDFFPLFTLLDENVVEFRSFYLVPSLLALFFVILG